MSDSKETDIVRIDLTNEQKEQVKAATDKSADAIELTVQELEARIAPRASTSDRGRTPPPIAPRDLHGLRGAVAFGASDAASRSCRSCGTVIAWFTLAAHRARNP